MARTSRTTGSTQPPKPAGTSRPNPRGEPAPAKGDDGKPAERPDPTRYGDWEKNGRCIDF